MSLDFFLKKFNIAVSQFFFECTEAESYLKEIAHLITTDMPGEEAAAEVMLAKHKTVQVAAGVDVNKRKNDSVDSSLTSRDMALQLNIKFCKL